MFLCASRPVTHSFIRWLIQSTVQLCTHSSFIQSIHLFFHSFVYVDSNSFHFTPTSHPISSCRYVIPLVHPVISSDYFIPSHPISFHFIPFHSIHLISDLFIHFFRSFNLVLVSHTCLQPFTICCLIVCASLCEILDRQSAFHPTDYHRLPITIPSL